MYTTTEASTLLDMHLRMIQRHIRQGHLKAEKRGRDYFIEEQELERFKRERKGRGRPRKREEQGNDRDTNPTRV